MRPKISRSTLLKLAFVFAATVVGLIGFAHPEIDVTRISASVGGPTTGHTGAPAEANCTACHSDFPVNSGPGMVAFSGIPPTWSPGQQFTIIVTASQKDSVIYGYQMTAVDSLGRQAGTLSVPATNPTQSQIQPGIVGTTPRMYAMHTSEGTIPAMFGSKSWTVLWTAPATRIGKVDFYVSGNGANSNGTTSGDYIYTASRSSTSGKGIFDLDGDAKTDLAIYRPAPGEWWWLKSATGGNAAVQFGQSSDRIVPSDYTGDGRTDIAFWRPSTGLWFVLRSEDFSFYSFPFGSNGDVPAPADYDNDGKSDAAIFRPSTNTWFISNSGGGTTIQQFGVAGDVPTPADYDGDGRADIAIYRPSLGQWWISRSSTGTVAFQFGSPTDKAVPGDYTGDGKADVAFWRPSTGEWFILRSENNSFFGFPFGSSTDLPVPGDYDGDAKVDAAVFRPSTSTWFAQRATGGTLIQQFGIAGDIPLPSAYVR